MVNNQWSQGRLWTNTYLKVEIITITIHGFFLLDHLVKKDSIWTSIKKTILSIWTSRFEVVHCDWVVFFIGKMLDYLIGHFD